MRNKAVPVAEVVMVVDPAVDLVVDLVAVPAVDPAVDLVVDLVAVPTADFQAYGS